MGQKFLDQYSFLHYAVGVVAYFWGIPLLFAVFAHVIFEYIENTNYGITFINTTLHGIWPGGKPAADSLLNQFGDTIAFGTGWLAAKWVNDFGKARNWY